MAVRSKRLAGPVQVTTTGGFVYACPAGETAIVKDIWVWPQSLAATALDIFLNGSTADKHIARLVLPNSGDARITNAFLCLQPGDTLRMTAVGANVTVVVSGTELEGVAD